MTRSPDGAGFVGQSALVASPKLIDAVAATLAISAVSLCLVVVITVLSARAGFAVPM